MGLHTLVAFNIRGTGGKTPALFYFIHKQNIDTLLLQETNFNTLEQAQTILVHQKACCCYKEI